jgi:hypothetical protein
MVSVAVGIVVPFVVLALATVVMLLIGNLVWMVMTILVQLWFESWKRVVFVSLYKSLSCDSCPQIFEARRLLGAAASLGAATSGDHQPAEERPPIELFRQWIAEVESAADAAAAGKACNASPLLCPFWKYLLLNIL